MSTQRKALLVILTSAALGLLASAQVASTNGTQSPGISVPRLIRMSAAVPASESLGRTLTFTIYADASGGSALWSETQAVTTDARGQYTVTLGEASSGGVPSDIFGSGSARWLEVSENGSVIGARMLLVSVPYALKSEDADMLGGHSISDFVLSQDLARSVQQQVASATSSTATSSGARRIPSRTVGTGQTTTGTNGNGSATFTDTSGFDVVLVQQASTGAAFHAIATTSNAIIAQATGSSPVIYGQATNTTGLATAVEGDSPASNGIGVYGKNTSTSGINAAVRGDAASGTGKGVLGVAGSATGANFGVYGQSLSTSGTGVQGSATAAGGIAVSGIATATSGTTVGVHGETSSTSGTAAELVSNTSTGKIIVGKGPSGVVKFTVDGAGNASVSGSLNVNGSISSSVGSLAMPVINASASNGTQAVNATQTSTGNAVTATNLGTTGAAVFAHVSSTTGANAALKAQTDSATGIAGLFNVTAGGTILSGQTAGTEIFRVNPTDVSAMTVTQNQLGIQNASFTNFPPSAILGHSTSATDTTVGVIGESDSPNGAGVVAIGSNATGNSTGLLAHVASPTAKAIEIDVDDQNSTLIEANVGANQTTNVTAFKVDAFGNVYAGNYLDLNGNSVLGNIQTVLPGTGLIGSSSGNLLTLSLDTLFTDGLYASLNTGNTFTGDQNVAGNVFATGSLNGDSLTVTNAVSASEVAANNVDASTITATNLNINGGLDMSSAVNLLSVGTADAVNTQYGSQSLNSSASAWNQNTAAAEAETFTQTAYPRYDNPLDPGGFWYLTFGNGRRGNTVMSVDDLGNLTAGAFYGDGSHLVNLPVTTTQNDFTVPQAINVANSGGQTALAITSDSGSTLTSNNTNGGYAINASTSGPSSVALYAANTYSFGSDFVPAGVEGASDSPNGIGVWGVNNNGGTGVEGYTAGNVAVYGFNGSAAGQTYGVYGYSGGADGVGVRGDGGGSNSGTDSIGIWGVSFGTTAASAGGKFENNSGGDALQAWTGGVERFTIDTNGIANFESNVVMQSSLTVGTAGLLSVDSSGNLTTVGVVQAADIRDSSGNSLALPTGPVDLLAQTGPISPTVIFTASGDGMYRVSVYINMALVDTGASGILSPLLTWNDGSSTQSTPLNSLGVSSSGYSAFEAPIFLASGQSVQFSVSFTGFMGASTYNVHIRGERL